MVCWGHGPGSVGSTSPAARCALLALRGARSRGGGRTRRARLARSGRSGRSGSRPGRGHTTFNTTSHLHITHNHTPPTTSFTQHSFTISPITFPRSLLNHHSSHTHHTLIIHPLRIQGGGCQEGGDDEHGHRCCLLGQAVQGDARQRHVQRSRRNPRGQRPELTMSKSELTMSKSELTQFTSSRSTKLT